MASTSLEIVISANDQFSAKANRIVGTLHSLGGAAKKVGTGVGQLGVGLAKVGVYGFAALATGIGAAAKQGIEFEDAFAGVRKTVGGSKESLDALYGSLRQLATRVPVKFTDLAAIATEAGALGVPANEVVHFTEVIARLSAATQGLTVEAASEAIGKLGNILHIHGTDVDRFASSLVALGNAGASTEADIIETAKRFGAAGSAAKLTASQVLGFSSAIASLGVEPEAAGSSLSRLFNKITLYIGTGNSKLKQFADTAHLSQDAFTKLFKKDSTEGLLAFLKGLGQLDRFQVAKVLKAAGITNIRDVNAVLLLSQNYGLLTDQLGVSSTAFKENTALAEASGARFGTLKNKLATLRNVALDAAVSVSEGLNPAIGRLADKLSAFVSGHKADFVQFGKDIGRFIDEIDWSRVAAGAETFVSVLKTILAVVKQIPPEIDASVAAFLGLNKLSGGLLGKGLGNIAGGLSGLIGRGIAAALPGKLGGLVGSLGAQPVYVTNWPLGGLGVPGLPAAAGAGAAEGAGAAAGLGFGTIAAGIAAGTAISALGIMGLGWLITATSTPGQLATNEQNSIDENRRKHGLGGSAASGPDTVTMGGFDSQVQESTVTLGGFTKNLQDSNITVGGFDSRVKQAAAAVSAANSAFTNAVKGLKTAKKAEDIRAAVKSALEIVIGKHKGSTSATEGVLGDLQKQLSHTHDPKTASILRAAIAKVEHKIVDRRFVDKELATAGRILKSSESTKQKLSDLTAIQKVLRDRGDIHAAKLVQAKIDGLKKADVAAANRTTQAVKDKDLSVVVNSFVTVRDIINGAGKVTRYGRVSSNASSSAGPGK